MARTFTREEFHALVWSRPMTHLAKEFALSDVALHKICRRRDIPTPPAGWWAKKAAGKPVRVTPLPVARADDERPIVIADGELRSEPRSVAAVREAARIRASADPGVAHAPSQPIIRRTIAALRKAAPAYTGLVTVEASSGLIKCEVAKASLERLEGILVSLVAAAAQQGFKLVADNQPARFAGPEEAVSFSVSERYRRVRHEPSEKEKVAEARWQRLRKRYDTRPWDLDWSKQPRIEEWDWVPTSQLAVELEGVYSRESLPPRRKFADGRVQRLEDLASDIAVGLAVTAAVKHASRLRAEEERRQAEAARRQREVAQRAAHVGERREAVLAGLLAELGELDRLRRLLADVRPTAAATSDPRVAEFIRWADGHLAHREAALSGEGLAKRFAAARSHRTAVTGAGLGRSRGAYSGTSISLLIAAHSIRLPRHGKHWCSQWIAAGIDRLPPRRSLASGA